MGVPGPAGAQAAPRGPGDLRGRAAHRPHPGRSWTTASGWSSSTTRASSWKFWSSWEPDAPAPLYQGGASGQRAVSDRLLPGDGLGPPPPPRGCTSPPSCWPASGTWGVRECWVTLHVGLGTFRPVKAEDIADHEMHSEYCEIGQETADIINETKRSGGRVICVGTTLLPHHRVLRRPRTAPCPPGPAGPISSSTRATASR